MCFILTISKYGWGFMDESFGANRALRVVWIRYGQALLDHNLPTLSVLSPTRPPGQQQHLYFFDEIIYRAIEGSG